VSYARTAVVKRWSPCFGSSNFLKVYISQGSAARHFGCGEIFGDCFIANFPESVPVKEL